MSKLNDKDLMNAGDISPSQLITTFGPGSVVNMRHDTVMIVGCHRWPKKEDKKKRNEQGNEEENRYYHRGLLWNRRWTCNTIL